MAGRSGHDPEAQDLESRMLPTYTTDPTIIIFYKLDRIYRYEYVLELEDAH